jgi:hypothetical protein
MGYDRVLYDVADSGDWFIQALMPLVGPPLLGLILPIFIDARRLREGEPAISRRARIALLAVGILLGALFAVPLWSTLVREGVGLATGNVLSVSGTVRSYQDFSLGKGSYATFEVDDKSFRVDCCDIGVHYKGTSVGNDDVLHNGMSVKLTYLGDGSIIRIEQLAANAEKPR